MAYNIDWIVPALSKPTHLWRLASTITMVAVGLFSKVLISTLTLRHLLCPSKMRWSLAAHDICFTCSQHSYFFSLGKCIPVIRGAGVYQKAVDFMIERLAKGDWVHIFPEGKVNMSKEHIRFKWGIGRMIFESPVPPIVVPIWHIGMDDVLPNEPPYVLRLRKNLTFNYGNPIDMSDMVRALKSANATEEEARKQITDFLQDRLQKLKIETEALHAQYFRSKS
ncbi:tafazzin isoform X2 [Dendroctonus ponderosae]|uniref:Tafazzin family protein n=1 Tax=Dendroctonus ponderosae TaxID=77166 RepID=A0AAR5QCT6_DENPD|nr:tafazzin isoform X2 [Dendroctonus ponderosae]